MHPRHDFCCSKQEGETPETPPDLRALQNVKGHEFYPQAPKKTFPGEHCFTGVKMTWLVETHLKANQRKKLYPAGRMVFLTSLLDRIRPPRVWQSASVEMEMYRVWVQALIKSQLHNQSWWGTTLHSLEHMLFSVDDKMSVLLFFVLPGIQSLCLSVIGFWESQIHPSFMLMNYWATRESSQSGWKSDDELTKEKNSLAWTKVLFIFLPSSQYTCGGGQVQPWLMQFNASSDVVPGRCNPFQLFGFSSFYYTSDRQGLSILLTKLLC